MVSKLVYNCVRLVGPGRWGIAPTRSIVCFVSGLPSTGAQQSCLPLQEISPASVAEHCGSGGRSASAAQSASTRKDHVQTAPSTEG
jgi:hypothetical protein